MITNSNTSSTSAAKLEALVWERTCGYQRADVCRYTQLCSRMTCCYRPWSRTDTWTCEWFLWPVAMTTGCFQNVASPSSPHGLNQKWWKWEEREMSETKWMLQFSCKLTHFKARHSGWFHALHIMTSVPQLNHKYIWQCVLDCYNNKIRAGWKFSTQVRAKKSGVEKKPKVERWKWRNGSAGKTGRRGDAGVHAEYSNSLREEAEETAELQRRRRWQWGKGGKAHSQTMQDA